MKNKLPNAVPKPRPKPAPEKRFSSIKRPDYKDALLAAQRLRSTTPPKRKNAKRASKEFERAYESVERVEWVKSLPCVVRGAASEHGGKIENAHTRTGGGSRKADSRWIVPMCSNHHYELHTHGKQTFESKYLVPLDDRAARTELAWQAFQSENSAAGGR